MQSMIEGKKCPKCGKTEKIKSGFMREKQGYKCKNCECNYTEGLLMFLNNHIGIRCKTSKIKSRRYDVENNEKN